MAETAQRLALLLLAVIGTARAAEVEVLHGWTSGGEARAAAELRKSVEARGHVWSEFAVAGGAGDSAMTVLRARVAAGDPPTAAQIKGPEIRRWAATGALASLDPVAAAGHWDQLLPAPVAEAMKFQGHYVAVPLDLHRVNWLWLNPEVLRRAGVGVPRTWDELLAAAQRIQRAGFIAVAHGGEPWQDFTLFESVVLGVAGPALYRSALVALDPAAFESPAMLRALETFRSLHRYVGRDPANRDWNHATALIGKGQAGMQFMGDWAKGELTDAGLLAGRDFACAPVPGTAGAFIYDVDSLAVFAARGGATRAARTAGQDLAGVAMSAALQQAFNLAKGALPVRQDLDLAVFDSCAQQAAREFRAAERSARLLPSVAHGMAQPAALQFALQDVVTGFFNGQQPPREAAARLAAIARRH